jgi:hypothetical protein
MRIDRNLFVALLMTFLFASVTWAGDMHSDRTGVTTPPSCQATCPESFETHIPYSTTEAGDYIETVAEAIASTLQAILSII